MVPGVSGEPGVPALSPVGGGKRSRARTCSDPRPANGGKECIGPLSDLGDCNSQFCPTPAAGVYIQVKMNKDIYI